MAGAWNHWSPVPLSWMPKFTPLRAMTVTMLLPGTPCGGVAHRLARRHRQVEEEVVVAGDERQRPAAAPPSSVGGQQRQRQPLEQQPGGRGVAVVHLVAHVQRLRHQRLELGIGQAAHRDLHGLKNSLPSQRSRSITSGELAPKRSTLPRPSLRLQ